MNILQIVPRLCPAIDGVGDHARLLAKQLRQDLGIKTHFVVGDPAWAGAKQVEGFAVDCVESRSAQALLSILLSKNTSTLLLHYVGYGYAKRGAPIWLVEGLIRWLQSDNKHRLITMFHEIFGFGPPWSSGFWLSPLQRHLAARLARMSEQVITSGQLYATVLRNMSQQRHVDIPTLPVFSNIGEPKRISGLLKRTKRLVAFGRPSHRQLVYRQHLDNLNRACDMLEIQEICDVGMPIGLNITSVNGIPIVEKGAISTTQVSELLQDSVAGFLSSASPTHLAKSGVFAAYCAHGLLPILPTGHSATLDGITCGEHYWVADRTNGHIDLVRSQNIADAAHGWYQTHNLTTQAKIFASHLALGQS